MSKRKSHQRQKNKPQRPKNNRFASFAASENRAICPHPEKKKFKDESSAEDFINKLHSRSAVKYGAHYLPNRSYRCDCEYWHITSKKLYTADEMIKFKTRGQTAS